MASKKSFFCMNTLKHIDAFAKPLEEVQIKTVWGGFGKNWFIGVKIIIVLVNICSNTFAVTNV